MGVAEVTEQTLAVLIIDDELSLAQSLAAGLQAAQLRALVADSALDALRVLEERPDIGVVITDVRMPDYDGLDLAQRIMAERREEEAVEIIVISGHATMETAATAVSTRVSALLYKPFRLAAMIKAVGTAMDVALTRRAAPRCANAPRAAPSSSRSRPSGGSSSNGSPRRASASPCCPRRSRSPARCSARWRRSRKH